MELHHQYASYQKKYRLPSFEQLNQEFELFYTVPIVQIDFPLRFIRRRIMDRFWNVCNFLQMVLQPNGPLIAFKESGFFSGEEKQEMHKLLQLLMTYERRAMVLDITGDEQGDAQFISDSLTTWIEIKQQYQRFAERLVDRWQQGDDKKQHIRDTYVG